MSKPDRPPDLITTDCEGNTSRDFVEAMRAQTSKPRTKTKYQLGNAELARKH